MVTLSPLRSLILIPLTPLNIPSNTQRRQATALTPNMALHRSKAPTLSLRLNRRVSGRTRVLRWRLKIPLSSLVLTQLNSRRRRLEGRGGISHLVEDLLKHSLLVSRLGSSTKVHSPCHSVVSLNELSHHTSRSLRSHRQPLFQIRRSSPSQPLEGTQVVVFLQPSIQVNREGAQLGEARGDSRLDKGDEVQVSLPSHEVVGPVEQVWQLVRPLEVLHPIPSRQRPRIHPNPFQGRLHARLSLRAWQRCGRARNPSDRRSILGLKLMVTNG